MFNLEIWKFGNESMKKVLFTEQHFQIISFPNFQIEKITQQE